MRWTELAPSLPVQPLEALAEREPALAALLQANPSRAGLIVAVSAVTGETVLRHLGDHAEEQGGLLVGEVFAEGADPACSRAVYVTQAVAAADFSSTGVSLRMASGVWEAARGRLGPRDCVVGWYHSHPGLGAFFSHTDRRTQQAFFPHAYSVGWVVDPLRGESAWFVGPRSDPPARVIAGGFQGGAGTSSQGGAPTTSTRFTK
jgi:proteasome lid subunit RPN8/RPN11